MGPLSVFHYLLTEVVGFGLDACCNPLVVMRVITILLKGHAGWFEVCYCNKQSLSLLTPRFHFVENDTGVGLTFSCLNDELARRRTEHINVGTIFS